MAFKDSNGKITIDEIAAQKDIGNLHTSVSYLESALSELNEIAAQAEALQGNTGSQIRTACQTLITNVAAMISETNESAEYIQAVVNKYEAIDASLKQTIINSID